VGWVKKRGTGLAGIRRDSSFWCSTAGSKASMPMVAACLDRSRIDCKNNLRRIFNEKNHYLHLLSLVHSLARLSRKITLISMALPMQASFVNQADPQVPSPSLAAVS
jgi:hypothetical protein